MGRDATDQDSPVSMGGTESADPTSGAEWDFGAAQNYGSAQFCPH